MESKEHSFNASEAKLITDSLTRCEHLGDGAQRHLREGFARRALIVRTSRLKMLDIAPSDRRTVLSTDECQWLNIMLNSFYFQMRGAMDNLAWALHYQHGLLGSGDENDFETQRRCYLFSNSFLVALDARVPELAHHIRAHLDWAKDFKQLRDPAAHRIPLYAVPGVATQEEADEFNEKWLEAMQLVRNGNPEAALATAAEADQLGRYEPIFAMSGPAGKQVRPLREQVDADYKEFLAVSRTVVDSLILLAA